MEPTLLIVAAAVVGGAALYKRYVRWTERFDSAEEPLPEPAAPQDRAFLQLIDEVTAQGGFTRRPLPHGASNGWQAQTLRRDEAADGAWVEVELQHAKWVQGGDHRVCARVHGVISQGLNLQSYDEVSFAGLDRHRPRRHAPREAQQNTTGDGDFDQAFILYRADQEAFAALNASGRQALRLLNQRADVSAQDGLLTATRRLPQLKVTPQKVLDFIEATLTCARSLRLDTSSEGLAAAWLATLRGDEPIGVKRRLLEVLIASAPHSQAVSDGCAALSEDQTQEVGVRLGAAKLCDERGWPLLEQTALSPEASASARLEALQALRKTLPGARAQALLVALLDGMVSGLEAEPPRTLEVALLEEAAWALKARPTPGVIDKLVTLFWALRSAAEGSDKARHALLSALSAQAEGVEAALLGLLPSLVNDHLRGALRTLQRRGTLETVLALKRHLNSDGLDDEERAAIQDAVGVIQARLSEGQDTGGALALVEAGALGGAGALALTGDKPAQ